MLGMDYRLVDTLNADQLEPDDLIGLAGGVCKIISITPIKYGYALIFEDEYNEKDVIEIFDHEIFNLYVMD